MYPHGTLPRACNFRSGHFLLETRKISGLGRLAFAFLWFLVFAIPWEDAVMVSGVGTVARLIGMLAGALGVWAILEKRRIRVPTPGHVLMILFVLWAAASYLWSDDPEQTVVAATTYLQLLVMVWLIWEFCSQEREQTRLLQAYVLGTYVSAIDTLYRYLSHQETTYQRYASTGFNPNDLALIMALSIPVSYYLTIKSEGLMVWVYRLQLVLAGTTVLLTASKGGLLASLAALAIVPLTHARLTRPQRIANIVTIAVLVCSGLFAVPSTSWERLSLIPKDLTQGTLDERIVIWKAGLEVFRAHPFLGVGAGAFQEAVSRTFSEPLVAHNTFLSILVEEGVIGFGLLCALMTVLVVGAKDTPPFPQRLWLVSLGVWAVGVCTATWELRKPTWFFFGLLMMQGASMVRRRPRGSCASGLAEHGQVVLHESRR